jgi:hypothetical protein
MKGNLFPPASRWQIFSSRHTAHRRAPSAKKQMFEKLQPTLGGPGNGLSVILTRQGNSEVRRSSRANRKKEIDFPPLSFYPLPQSEAV